MAAGTYNLVIDQGSDFNILLNVTQSGAAVDLTGYSARAQLRTARIATGAADASFTCTVVSPATAGQIEMSLSNSVSSALAHGKYFYDLEIYTSGDGQVTRLLQGEAIVTPEVTR